MSGINDKLEYPKQLMDELKLKTNLRRELKEQVEQIQHKAEVEMDKIQKKIDELSSDLEALSRVFVMVTFEHGTCPKCGGQVVGLPDDGVCLQCGTRKKDPKPLPMVKENSLP